MSDITFGISVGTTVIAIFVFIVYFVILLMLGWESHSKYGIGFFTVGSCFIGGIGAFCNYQYWGSIRDVEGANYPMLGMLAINLFLALIGLWGYLIYHSIVLHKSKARRSGARLATRVFAEESAATGTGRFRDQLQGWEGDMKLDMLIVEHNFDAAEDYLQGVIMKSTSERDNQKARHYEQYELVISKERLFAEESTGLTGKVEISGETKSGTEKENDIHGTNEIKEEDLPEGWSVSE